MRRPLCRRRTRRPRSVFFPPIRLEYRDRTLDISRRPAWTVVGAGFLVAALLAASCSKEQLPTAPSALTYGIVIYEHSNFLGRSALLTTDVEDLSDYEGPCEHESTSTAPGGYPSTTYTYDWEDCISSIKLTPGWRATIYEDRNFHGASFELTADVPDLQLVVGPCRDRSFNDCVSSIRLRPR